MATLLTHSIKTTILHGALKQCGDALVKDSNMKAEIHPDYKAVTVVCNCGNTFPTRSTYRQETMRVDICNECHPFYTGKHKIVDTEGRIDKFWRRYGAKDKIESAKEASESK